ncbi:cytochrome P450 [Chiua virens]|nr:cytochrome P450 [Chiua virens]
MTRDKTLFQNAEEFIPERFINDDGKLNDINLMDFGFGFGRRISPGRHVADASLFAAIATMPATFEFHPPKDAQDNDVASKTKWVNGVTHHPETFPCLITPRPRKYHLFVCDTNKHLRSPPSHPNLSMRNRLSAPYYSRDSLFSYVCMDKKDESHALITAKLIANMLQGCSWSAKVSELRLPCIIFLEQRSQIYF